MEVTRRALGVLALGCMLVSGAASARKSTSPRPVDASAEAAAIAERARERRQVPGLSVVILKRDDVLVAQGFGLTRAGGRTVDATTVFQLGSIGKQFLAALVLALAAEGVLSIDDPVVRHLPEFERLPDRLAVRHLLNHTSGLRELFSFAEAREAFDDLNRTREGLTAFVRKVPVDFPPGSRWSYSNTNYTVLAILVERLTRRPYEEVLADRFFRPLGLRSMRQCTSRPRDDAEAHGHERRRETVVAAAPENMEWIRGDGGLCGSADDLARWTRLLATGRVIAPALYERMVAPTPVAEGQAVDYGFGLSLVRPDGRPKIAHNGAMRGFSASAAYYPDAELTVVVLANRGEVRPEAIERQIARRLLGAADPDVRPRDLTSGERQRFTGVFDIGVFDVQVVDRKGTLWLQMPPPGPTTALNYLGGGAFVSALDPDASAVTFTGETPAVRMRLFMGAMQWYGTRAPKRITFATDDGGTIHADEYGEGERGVVLAHGGRFNKGSWAAQAKALQAGRFRVVALDFRGYGNSKGPGMADVLSAPLHLDVSAAVRYLRSTGAKTVFAVGGSMGGAAAAEAAAAQPGSIDRLVLLGSEGGRAPEKLALPKLFIVTRDDASGSGPRLPRIQAHFDRAPEPKRMLILDGSAHAQYMFETPDGEWVMREIVRFLSAPE